MQIVERKKKSEKTEGTGFNWMTAAAFDGKAWCKAFQDWIDKLMAKDNNIDGRTTSSKECQK